MSTKLSLKKQFVNDGLKKAEIDTFLKRELAEEGYIDVKIVQSGNLTKLHIFVTGVKGGPEDSKRIKDLSSLISTRFGIDHSRLKCFYAKIPLRGLSASAQCESLKYRLISGVAVRQYFISVSITNFRAAYACLRAVMDAGARGCEVVVSGKVRGQRAKSMKFVDGVMIHAGHAANTQVEEAVRHVYMRQGMLGVKVKINKSQDAQTAIENGMPLLPDNVYIYDVKDEAPSLYTIPYSTDKDGVLLAPERSTVLKAPETLPVASSE